MVTNGAARIDAETRSIVDRIVDYRIPKRVILFGSRGRGDARPDSDVDLCVLYEKLEKRNIEVMQDLYLRIFGHGGHPVDLVVYEEGAFAERAMKPGSFEAAIESQGVAVYG